MDFVTWRRRVRIKIFEQLVVPSPLMVHIVTIVGDPLAMEDFREADSASRPRRVSLLSFLPPCLTSNPQSAHVRHRATCVVYTCACTLRERRSQSYIVEYTNNRSGLTLFHCSYKFLGK